jgi:hypothetical protein
MEMPNVFDQLMAIYVQPEIVRRQAIGELPRPLALRAAQIICFADERPNVVRLNDEVQAVAKVKLRTGVSKGLGEPIFHDEIEGYETIVLPETEDPDCGHATMLLFRDEWFVVFDFRYNRGKSQVYLDRAHEFLLLAESARLRNAWASMVYVLFSAAELAARAELLVVGDKAVGRAKTHKATTSRFNQWARMGNVAVAHKDALNRLAALRPDAGYSARPFQLGADEADSLIDAVHDLIGWTASRLTPIGPGVDSSLSESE